MGVRWLSMQRLTHIWLCTTAVTVVAQINYFVSASYFDRKPSYFKCVVILDDFGIHKITRAV